MKLVFDLYVQGYGYYQIISELNTRGLKTKNGKPFGKNSINSILKNEKYFGVYIFNKAIGKDARGKRTNRRKEEEDIIKIPGGMPAIVTEDMFIEAQAKMRRNKTTYASYQAVENYMLSGLIFCGECGSTMVGNRKFSGRSKLKYVTYRCNNRDRTKSCCNKEIRREYIEEYVVEQLHAHLFNDSTIPELAAAYIAENNDDGEKEIAIIKKQLQETDNQINNIVEAVAKGFTHGSFLSKMEELETNKAAMELRINEFQLKEKRTVITEDILRDLFSRFKSFVIDKNYPEIKKFIQHYVEKVVVHSEHVDVIFKLDIVVTFGGGEGI